MRRLLWVLALLFPFAPLASPAAQSSSIVMTAQQIALNSDRGLLVADGGVSVRMPGFTLNATRVQYDLRANNLVANGDVSVTDASGTVRGSGYTYDFKTRSGHFLKSVTIPELATQDAIAVARQVELFPGQNIAFTNAQVRSGATLSPVAAYTYYIPAPTAKDFGYSPVPSAALEFPFLLTHASDSYTFVRARYDKYNGGPGAGFEEHYARTSRGYAVLAETMDVDGSRYDMVAYQSLNDHLSQTLTGSSLIDTRALRYSLTSSGRHGLASLSFSQYNAQRSDDFLLSGNQRPIGKIGTFRLQNDLGHDVHPYDYAGSQDFRTTPSVFFNSAGVRFGRATLSTSIDAGETFYNYGRATLSTSQTFWGTFPLNSHHVFSGGATFSHVSPPYPSTARTYTLGDAWSASRTFNLVSSLTYTHDSQQAFGYGRPEFSAAFDLRAFRRNGTGFELGALIPFGGVGNMNRQAGLNLRFLRQVQ